MFLWQNDTTKQQVATPSLGGTTPLRKAVDHWANPEVKSMDVKGIDCLDCLDAQNHDYKLYGEIIDKIT